MRAPPAYEELREALQQQLVAQAYTEALAALREQGNVEIVGAAPAEGGAAPAEVVPPAEAVPPPAEAVPPPAEEAPVVEPPAEPPPPPAGP